MTFSAKTKIIHCLIIMVYRPFYNQWLLYDYNEPIKYAKAIFLTKTLVNIKYFYSVASNQDNLLPWYISKFLSNNSIFLKNFISKI